MSRAATDFPVAYGDGAFAGVRTRRVFAWLIDVCFVSLITALVWFVLTIGTLGLSLFILPPLFPTMAVIYHALTVSGSGRGTWGMRALDLEVVDYVSGHRASLLQAGAQAILFYLSWTIPLLFIFTLVDGEKRYLHDLLSGLVVTRRPR